jgi:hypothetical protein
MSPPVMEIALVKAVGPGDRDRAWLTAGGLARRGPVHRLSWPLARDFFAGRTEA